MSLTDISKIYRVGTFGGKELRAVNDVSFDVKDGEVVSLIGESGSGKSTIGKMILRLIAINSGAIRFDGIDVSGHSKELRSKNITAKCRASSRIPSARITRSSKQTASSASSTKSFFRK